MTLWLLCAPALNASFLGPIIIFRAQLFNVACGKIMVPEDVANS